MADGTKIEWTDATWNPITGCKVVSPGCTNCYAMKLAGGRLRHLPSRKGLTKPSKAGPVWNGGVRFNADWLDQPFRWRHPRRVFVCAHGDLFYEGVPDDWIDQVFAVMALCRRHSFQVLTKRPERMRGYLSDLHRKGITEGRVERAAENIGRARHWDHEAMSTLVFEAVHDGLPNVWLGTSVENQATADERIPPLLYTPAAVRFLSVEPLLRAVEIRHYLSPISLVICGGESGPRARPMHPDWARSLRDQCAAAGVAFFMKQMTKKAPIPADLMVREFPE